MNRRRWVRLIASVLVAVTGLFLLQRLVTPKYVDDVVEGAFIAQYYREEDKNFDVIFVGDCEVYENFSPVRLWENYGINSYIRGSAEQYIFQSYYLLEDTLRYETPQVAVFNVQALQFSEARNEAYNRMTLEGMRWSLSKVNAIRASMRDEESFLSYVFPILRYHSRWSELTVSDFRYLLSTPDAQNHNGYYMRVDVLPAENIPEAKPLGDYSFGENAWKYLEKMVDLCEERGVELLLIKAPSLYPHWYDEWDEQVVEFAQERNLRYINFLDLVDEIGIDFTTDTYDAGLHMNLSGAEKLSDYIGKVLTEELGVPDRRGDAKLDAIWAENIAAYEADRQAQYEKYGLNDSGETDGGQI